MKDFDSWGHVMDEDDIKALESGKSPPINRTAHQQISKQTRSALKKLTDDPEALKRLVKKHRMAGNDDISAFASHQATNPSSVEPVAAPPSTPMSSKPMPVST